MNRRGILLAMVMGVWWLPAVAETVATLPESLRACMAERQDSQRLVCFDRETARLAQRADAAGPPHAAAPVVPAAPVAAAAAAPAVPAALERTEEKFGYRGKLARAELDEQKAAAATFDELTATITQLSTQPRGEMVVTLSNGQVWAQKAADRSIRLEVGEQVNIRRASLGSFLLSSVNSRGSMRVVRLQ